MNDEEVAVKVFLSNLENKIDISSYDDLIKTAQNEGQIYQAYKEIRKEVKIHYT